MKGTGFMSSVELSKVDHSKYEFTRRFYEGLPFHTDDRHIDILYRLALNCPQNSLIVEIGSYMGATATAYVEAMRVRKDLRLRLYDIKIRKQLSALLKRAQMPDRIEVLEKPIWCHLREPAELVFIDGNHEWPALADLAICLATGCRVIAAHDTRYQSKDAHGSRMLGEILRNVQGRQHYEDFKKREGEWTDRGFLVSWLPQDKDWVCKALPSE